MVLEPSTEEGVSVIGRGQEAPLQVIGLLA